MFEYMSWPAKARKKAHHGLMRRKRRIHRLPLTGFTHVKPCSQGPQGLTQGCPGCQAMLSGMYRQGHSEERRGRMQDPTRTKPSGQARLSRQEERENMKLARKLEDDERKLEHKKARKGGLERRAAQGAGNAQERRRNRIPRGAGGSP